MEFPKRKLYSDLFCLIFPLPLFLHIQLSTSDTLFSPLFYSVHSFGFVEPGTMELCGGGDLPRFFRSRNSLLPSQRRAVTSHCSLSLPFSPIVPTPRSCGAGGLGRSKLFFLLPLRLSEGRAPSPGVEGRQQLLSCLAQGSRNREGH